jgi:hypothetical protein
MVPMKKQLKIYIEEDKIKEFKLHAAYYSVSYSKLIEIMIDCWMNENSIDKRFLNSFKKKDI